jgi:hypothetical protein
MKLFGQLQTVLGCRMCKFVDKAALGNGPCCRYPGSIVTAKSGRCLMLNVQAKAKK